jgi:molybdopterin-containing oxidoreductase family membrane subunit
MDDTTHIERTAGGTVRLRSTPQLFLEFVKGSASVVARGGRGYYAWILLLLVVVANGLFAYREQLVEGLIVTNMRDPMSWGFYIGNFAYLVGVAAAAVVLVIPAYIYRWQPIKEVVLFGEIMAVVAIVMCILFVTVDMGRPERVWHMMPLVGAPNFPYSMLIWDVLALSSYFLLNYFVVSYLLYKDYTGQHYSQRFILPIVFLSIPLAIGIHTVTAFLFMGLKSRPFWHTAILAPRFIAGAFVSGQALMVLVLLTVRHYYEITISNAALRKIGELLAYAMAVNLFFVGVEAFTEFYSRTAHTIHADLQWFGTHGLTDVAVYSWTALSLNALAFIVFLVPELRTRTPLLAIGCAMAASGIFLEKGLGLLLPGMVPDALGEFYAYWPSVVELSVGAGIWALGALLFTLGSRVAIAVDTGALRHASAGAAPVARSELVDDIRSST